MIRQAVAMCFGLLFALNVFAAGSSAPVGNDDLDVKLADARARLEAAARDVAQLSSQLSGQLSQQLSGEITSATAEGMRGAAEGMRQAAERMRTLHTRAVLGLQVQTDQAGKDQGVRVIEVSPGGPAAEAGVHPGDVIMALNGTPTTGSRGARDLVERMEGVEPDSKVSLKLLRAGKPLSLTVTARPVYGGFAWTAPGAVGHETRIRGDSITFGGGPDGGCGPFSGLELAALSPGLGQYFGTHEGVLVVRALHAGEGFPLQDGDVILSIDGRVPQDGLRAIRILCSYQPGEKVHLKLMRQKKGLDVEVSVPEQPRDRSGHAMPPAPPVPPIAGEPPAGVIPAPQSGTGDCLNPRPPPIDRMPGAQAPCIRLPNPLPPQRPSFVPLLAGNEAGLGTMGGCSQLILPSTSPPN